MKGLNEVRLIGNLGGDPEMKFTPNGKAVVTFGMATSRKYKGPDNGDLVEETTWHRITVWDSLAEACNKSLHKGDPVYVGGRVRNSSWEDDLGVKHYSSDVVATNVIFLGKPKAASLIEEAVAIGAEVVAEESSSTTE